MYCFWLILVSTFALPWEACFLSSLLSFFYLTPLFGQFNVISVLKGLSLSLSQKRRSQSSSVGWGYKKEMKKTMCCFLMCSSLQIIMTSILATTIRPLESYHAAQLQRGQTPHFPQPAYSSKQGLESINQGEVNGEEEKYRWLSRLGSRPPSCLHKCEGCSPCYPIQTPATTDHVGLHYANYEPEGWKCKCSSSFFNP